MILKHCHGTGAIRQRLRLYSSIHNSVLKPLGALQECRAWRLACALAVAPVLAAGSAFAQQTGSVEATTTHTAGRALTAASLARDPALLPSGAPIAVTTYHNDTLRTGWNPNETVLTEANVHELALQHTVAIDGQVDAQPLVVPAVTINGVTHDVVYTVTEHNSVYAIDAYSGAVLLQSNLGTPVPQSALPGQCDNNDSLLGITATPVIDPAAGIIYVIAYVYSTGKQTYLLHALNLSTLRDRMPPVTVAATGRLANGAAYNFDPTTSRSRAALLLSQGNVYAGFSSFCDGTNTRGWLLGWHASNLAPFGGEYLTDQNSTAPSNRFLTSIWMAGFGIAADPGGSLYFATGNSEIDGKAWNASTDLEESVVRYAGSLAGPQDYYTPNNSVWGQVPDDAVDNDVGAGGVMLLPTQPGGTPNLAVAGGKNTGVLLLNRDHLGGYGSAQLDQHDAGPCWCGPVYFADSSGVGHVVVPAGNKATIFTVQTSPTPKLVRPVTTPSLVTGQDGGFFASVSTNGLTPGTTLLWAVSRPVNYDPGYITLYVYDAFSGVLMTQQTAGIWHVPGGDSNVTPTVANGHVYVGSYHQLTIFGLGAADRSPGAARASIIVPPQDTRTPLPASTPHEVWGTVTAINGAVATLKLRDGTLLQADFSAARGFTAETAHAGQALHVLGNYTSGNGGFKAMVVLKAKPQPGLWYPDR